MIPVYNRAASIGPTLSSVAAQSDGDWECIIVDDGSDDGDELGQAIRLLNDDRFRLIRRANGGGGAARNTGIDAARGRYIAFLDSDDRFLPEKLARFRARFGLNPSARAAYSPFFADRRVGKLWIRPARAIRPGEDVGEYLFVANQFIQTSTIVVEREAAALTRFDPALRKGQDLDFCLRLQADGVCFTMIDEPLTIFADGDEDGRTSRTPGFEASLAWLDQHRPLLTDSAYHGYRATTLAYYMAKRRPLRAGLDLVNGWLRGGVTAKIIARQALRAYLPRRLYRSLVDRVVASRGTLLSDKRRCAAAQHD